MDKTASNIPKESGDAEWKQLLKVHRGRRHGVVPTRRALTVALLFPALLPSLSLSLSLSSLLSSQTTAQDDYADRPNDYAGKASGDFHTGSHFSFGTDEGEKDSTYQHDYKKKMAELARRKQAASKAIIDPYAKSNVPRGPLGDDEWAKGATSTSRDAFQGRGGGPEHAFEPKLQGTHFKLGEAEPDYRSTVRTDFDPKQVNYAGVVKQKKNESSMPKGDVDGWKKELVTSQQEQFRRRDDQDARGDSVPSNRHLAKNFTIGGDSSEPMKSTYVRDYEEKRARAERARPSVDPHKSNLPRGELDDDAWKNELQSEGSKQFAFKMGEKRTAFNPNLQRSNMAFGSAPTTMTTSAQDTLKDRSKESDVKVHSRSNPKGRTDGSGVIPPDPEWAKNLKTSAQEQFVDHNAQRPVPTRVMPVTHTNVSFGDGAFDPRTTHKQSYDQKRGDAERVRPTIDPYATNMKKGEISDKEWADQLRTTGRDAYVAGKGDAYPAVDPNLQETHFHVGSERGQWTTEVSENYYDRIKKLKEAHDSCCPLELDHCPQHGPHEHK